VSEILHDLGLSEDTPVLEVWNKIDRFGDEDREALIRRAERENCHPISAVSGEGIDALLRAIEAGLEQEHLTEVLTLGFDRGRQRAWLFDQGVVVQDEQVEDGHRMTVRWTAKQAARFRAL
jgi:GTP-binding protein HflX